MIVEMLKPKKKCIRCGRYEAIDPALRPRFCRGCYWQLLARLMGMSSTTCGNGDGTYTHTITWPNRECTG